MKLIVILLMILYLYSLSYGVFMTELFRIPAPMVFCFPLIFLFKEKIRSIPYHKEIWAILAAIFFYYIIGLSDVRSFLANSISVGICILYFYYFISSNTKRYNYSIIIFYSLLTFSAIVMVFNNYFPAVNSLREFIMGEPVLQSPSGIAISQFTFGYQLAALAPFLLIYTFLFHKPLLVKVLVFLTCLGFIYLGMQRSVLVTFVISVTLFLMYFYRFKAVLVITTAIFAGVVFFNFVLEENTSSSDNILAKNINNDASHNRTLLTAENLNIYADYPLGLVFYGKTWGDAIYRSQVFSSGFTSHNAYLMFITYLGPFLGLGLLVFIYSKVVRIGFNALKEIRFRQNKLLLCLCFSFLAISINALSHNAWLISADGPTLFLYFSILHLNKLQTEEILIQDLAE
ncbi:MAG TPA: hypothetical protein VGD22_09485 [Sphingobacteriaceae bacterium]